MSCAGYLFQNKLMQEELTNKTLKFTPKEVKKIKKLVRKLSKMRCK